MLLISILADGDVPTGFDFEMQQIAWCTGDNDDVKRLLWADAFLFLPVLQWRTYLFNS